MTPIPVALVVGLLAIVQPGAVQAEAPCESGWSLGFHLPGFDGDVLSMAVFDDGGGPALFVGGEFSAVGSLPVKSLARWDGRSWTDVGGGVTMSGTNEASVYAMRVFDDGSGPALFVAGQFSKAGGSSAARIAKWNGHNWAALTTGGFDPTSRILALAVFDDGSGPALYAGGHFVTISGVVVNNIAKWSGSHWLPVGTGMSITGSFTYLVDGIHAMEAYDDGSGPALYVGGDFDQVGGVFAGNLVRWNGNVWTDVAGGVGPVGEEWTEVRSLRAFDDGSGQGESLFVGGRFHTAGAIAASRIARWSRSGWSVLGRGVYSAPTIDSDSVDALSVFNDDGGPALFVGGRFKKAGDASAASIAKWDGRGWSPLGDGVRANGDPATPVAALATYDAGSGPALFAGGAFAVAGQVGASRFAAWNGRNWNAPVEGLGTDSYVTTLGTVELGSGPLMFAGGEFQAAGSVLANRIAMFDGQTWSPLGDGFDDWDSDRLCSNPVRAFAGRVTAHGYQLFTGGLFDHIGSMTANSIACWDGSRWTPLGEGLGLPRGDLGCWPGAHCLKLHERADGFDLYVGGVFDTAGGVSATNIARWDGEAWHALGDGLEGEVSALWIDDASDPDNPVVYAGGGFSMPEPGHWSRVARWNGRTWEQIAIDLDLDVYALLLTREFPPGRETLYAGGRDDPLVAMWDGHSWTAVGQRSGASPVEDMSTLALVDLGCGLELVAGGDPNLIGGVVARGIAAYNGSEWHAIDGGLFSGPTSGAWITSMTIVPGASGESLLVGGLIERSGQTPSGNIAVLPLQGRGRPSADLDMDGHIGGMDLALLLGQWGACPKSAPCAADLNEDGVVNGLDLGILLGAWG